MRILFATRAEKNISTVLNHPNFARLNEMEGVQIDFYNQRYADYDVILFMGYDPEVAAARAAKADLKIGIIDPRPVNLPTFLGADFLIVNGLEMQDWYADYFSNIFYYPICPQVSGDTSLKEHIQKSPFVIGYHGNKVHLAEMYPYVWGALEQLAHEYPLEFWAIYNVEHLKELPAVFTKQDWMPVRTFQWEEGVYENVLSKADIGIVPSVIPVPAEANVKQRTASKGNFYGEQNLDYLLRFKSTSNAGRIYIFSQLGIPVVAGMTPSAGQAIRDGYDGYIAHSAGGWYRALKTLLDSAELRTRISQRQYESYRSAALPEVLNHQLVAFLQGIQPGKSTPPAALSDAGKKIESFKKGFFSR